MSVSDIVMDHLNVLFVGYNPSLKSEQMGHHFAGPGNLFWALLADANITGRRLEWHEDQELLAWGAGIVNLVDRPSASAAELTPEELASGAQRLRVLIAVRRPKIVAFLGKAIYRHYRGFSRGQALIWGIQQDGAQDGVWDVVLPNPSRRSTLSYEIRLKYYRELYGLIQWGPHPRP